MNDLVLVATCRECGSIVVRQIIHRSHLAVDAKTIGRFIQDYAYKHRVVIDVFVGPMKIEPCKCEAKP